MEHSDSISNLAAALAATQAEMPSVQMNSVNPFLHNRFADLGAVVSASIPVMSRHGLSISQFPKSDGTLVGLTSILMHSSGEWLSDTIMLTLGEEKGKSDAQVAGSIITYLRRYAWSSILGLYVDEDSDGNGGKPRQQAQPAKQQAPKMTLEQALKTTGSDGAVYSSRPDAQLQAIANNEKAPPEKREAARLILADRAATRAAIVAEDKQDK